MTRCLAYGRTTLVRRSVLWIGGLCVAATITLVDSTARTEDSPPATTAEKTKESTKESSEEKAARERKERYLVWMTKHASDTEVMVASPDGGPMQPATRSEKAIFRYSDEEHRIPDATLWVWTRDNRPVAFQKVEGNNFGGGRAGTICFTSASERLISAKWPSRAEFKATKPGVTFRPIPDAPPPSANPRTRAAQFRELKDRFTARLGNSSGNDVAAARTLPKPLFEYFEPDSKLPVGAVFGMTSTGTNPNFLLVLEVRSDSEGQPRWEYAHARMTGSAVEFRYDDTVLVAEKGMASGNFGNWIFFFMERNFD